MGDSSAASYIHLVQHLIEECLIFKMSKEDCMEALSKHANILPVITSTVWNELEKENKDFFEAYTKGREERESDEEFKVNLVSWRLCNKRGRRDGSAANTLHTRGDAGNVLTVFLSCYVVGVLERFV